MIRDRVELENKLVEVMDEIKYSRKTMEKVNQQAISLKFPVHLITEIAENKVKIDTLTDAELCIVTLCVRGAISDEDDRINPFFYFTDTEISTAKNNNYIKSDDVSLPLTIEQVVQGGYDNYITFVDIKDIVKWLDAQILIYDFETQRSPKYKKSGEGIVPVPEVKLKSVKEIAEAMLNETYLPDTLRLNIYSDEVDPLHYDSKTMELTINEGATVSILDGFHRMQGAVRALSVNPDLELKMELSIRFYDLETSRKFFGQINTINKISKGRLQELKQEKLSDFVVKELQLKSDLKGKIASADKINEDAGHLTTFTVLTNAINDVFEINSKLEMKELSMYLIDFFDYLVGSYPEEFTFNIKKHRQESYINNPYMFIGYVTIAKYLQNKKLSELKQIIEGIDFSKDNQELQELFDKKNMDTIKVRRRIIDYFNAIFD